jgi:hypothetical protein
MVEPAEARKCDHRPVFRPFDRSATRRVARKGHVWTVRVVEFRVLANATKEMTFAEHDHVVGQLASERRDEPLGKAVLPRRARRDAELSDTEVVHTCVKDGAEDSIAIADEEPERAVGAEGLDDLLCRPRRVRVRRDVDMEDPSALEREHDEHIEDVEGPVGTVKKSIASVPAR